MLISLSLAVALALAPTSPSVALKCKFETEDMTFNLNEQQQTATYTTATSIFTKPARFTPDEVIVVISNDSISYGEWRISRTNLKLQRTIKIGRNAPIVGYGTCELYNPANRKF